MATKEPVTTLTIAAIARQICASEYSVKQHIKKNNIQPIGYADANKKRPLYSKTIIKKMGGCKLRKKDADGKPVMPNQTIIKSVRFNKAEYTHIKRVAKKHGMSIGELLKQAASKKNISRKAVQHIQVADPVLLRQVAHIGNNLNQIARSMNLANKAGKITGALLTATYAMLSDIDSQLQEINR